METEDLIDLPASSNSGGKSGNDDFPNPSIQRSDADSTPSNLEVKEDKVGGENLGTVVTGNGNGDSHILLTADIGGNLIEDSTALDVNVEVKETIAVAENVELYSFEIHAEKGCLTAKEGNVMSSLKRDGSAISYHEGDESTLSSAKRAKLAVEPQPSVQVVYTSLTRGSKQKLVELLQQWSEWHAQHCSAFDDSNEVLESGEETYFPALRVGHDKPSAVSFWMDNQPRNQQSGELSHLDINSVPLYDRGYSLGLTSADGSTNLEGNLEKVDSSRCFNCGSYSHSLKECLKPRDTIAVNNARKQHRSRRNLNISSRNPTRYYQNSPGGKYEGLRPGVLDAETRQLLGLRELDPPPWLSRMREMGYPPGYLDPDNEDQPSGITIFADDENKEETEDGEILEMDDTEPPRKTSVEFPGINAPIPANADEKRWGAGPSSFDLHRNNSYSRPTSSPEYVSRDHDRRWSRNFGDQGSPGCEPGFSPSLSGYSRRVLGYNSNHTSHSPGGNSIPRSPSYGRSLSDRGRWSPSAHEGSSGPGSYSSILYSPPSRQLSPYDYDSASYKKWDKDRSDFSKSDSSRHKGRHDAQKHHRYR